ncbi:MAG TPA: DUF2007 domain-containing protein [Arachidicoccus soli]|nr:DUF2007 domain-containing protein [Arachidicoccus soli]
MTKYTTVYTSMSLPEIYLIKGKFESEGIVCFTKDELITQTAPYISSITNGIQLQVADDDIDKAVQILQESGYLQAKVSKKTSYKSGIIFIIILLAFLFYIFKKNHVF